MLRLPPVPGGAPEPARSSHRIPSPSCPWQAAVAGEGAARWDVGSGSCVPWTEDTPGTSSRQAACACGLHLSTHKTPGTGRPGNSFYLASCRGGGRNTVLAAQAGVRGGVGSCEQQFQGHGEGVLGGGWHSVVPENPPPHSSGRTLIQAPQVGARSCPPPAGVTLCRIPGSMGAMALRATWLPGLG